MKGLWIGLVVVLLFTLTASPIRIQQISHVPIFSGSDAFEYLVDQCDLIITAVTMALHIAIGYDSTFDMGEYIKDEKQRYHRCHPCRFEART